MEMLSNYIEASICVVAIGLTPNHISIQWKMSNITRGVVFSIAIWCKLTEVTGCKFPFISSGLTFVVDIELQSA